MKAVWYDRQGPARDVLQFGDRPTPGAGPGEVRVKLAASAVNYTDCYRRGGGRYGQEFPLIIPNSDGAGTVDQVGAGVSPMLLGKRIWLYNGQRFRPFGTAAEYIALAEDLVTELPDSVGFAEGATLGIPCMTAHLSVFSAGPVNGKTLLVTGGAGAVGNYAIQLAKWAGALVVATASTPEKTIEAQAAGADLVVNYRGEDVVARVLDFTRGEGVDHVVEVDFGGNLDAALNSLKANGSIAFYASRGDEVPRLQVRKLIQRNVTLRAVGLPHARARERRAAQEGISQWLRSATPRFMLAAQFALSETAAAHEAVERNDKRGTVIVTL